MHADNYHALKTNDFACRILPQEIQSIIDKRHLHFGGSKSPVVSRQMPLRCLLPKTALFVVASGLFSGVQRAWILSTCLQSLKGHVLPTAKKLCRLKIQVWVYWNREAPSATSKSTGNGLNLATICRIYRLVINKIHLRLQNHGGFIDEQSKIVQRIMSTSCCFHSPSASIALDRLESTAPGGRTKDFQIHCPPWALDSQT